MGILYELTLAIGFLFYLPGAFCRRRLPHRGWAMRLGRYPAKVRRAIEGRRPVWLHAVSVGEAVAARPLARALIDADPARGLVLSTITPGGFAMATQVAGAVPVYFPLDFRASVTRALDALRPGALLLVESEWWPTMLRLTRRRGVPIAVVNGRLSPRAFRRYRRARGWAARLLRDIDLFLMQSQGDADRAIELGAPPERLRVTGSLKWDASVGARPSPEAIREAAARLGLAPDDPAPVIVAGSTHRGEEAAVLSAFRAVREASPRARLIIAPRHLERVAEVETEAREAGFDVVRASAPAGGWDVAVVDRFGELARYYGLAHAVFIGGSLVPHGGQNPLEATSLGKPIVFGPFMHNFAEIAERLMEHGAARQLASVEELSPVLRLMCADTGGSRVMGARAQALTERSQGALARTLAALQPLLR